MSSMDSCLNRQVGILARNVVPRLRELFGKKPEMTPKGEILLCKLTTVAIGGLVLFYSIQFSLNKELALFDAYLMIDSIIGIPLVFPMLVGFWVRKVPSWSYFAVFGFCLIPSAYSYYLSETTGAGMTIQTRAMWILVFGALGTICSMPFFKRSPAEYKQRVEEFFTMVRTPVDFEKEIGESKGRSQLLLLGSSSLGVGLAVLLLFLVPNGWAGRLSILFIAGFSGGFGALLLWVERIERKKEERRDV